MTDIQIKYWANRISDRHNREMEAQGRTQLGENARHNVASERASMLQAYASQAQAAASQRNAATNAYLADLNAARLEIEKMIADADVVLKESQTVMNRSTALLNEQRVLESQQDVLQSQQTVTESQARTGLLEAQTRTENVMRVPGTIGSYATAANTIVRTADNTVNLIGNIQKLVNQKRVQMFPLEYLVK